jgi:hypothetical protein
MDGTSPAGCGTIGDHAQGRNTMNQEKRVQVEGFWDYYRAQLAGFEGELEQIPYGLAGSPYSQRRTVVEGRAERRREWIAEMEARLVG